MCLIVFPLSFMKRNYKKDDTAHVQHYDFNLDFTQELHIIILMRIITLFSIYSINLLIINIQYTGL